MVFGIGVERDGRSKLGSRPYAVSHQCVRYVKSYNSCSSPEAVDRFMDEFDFDADALRKKPEPYLYMFTMPAMELRKLSDVFRRERVSMNDEGEGIRRALEERRTSRIKDFVKVGYPYCTLSENLRRKNESLRKPSWLPTAIVVNILTSADERRDRKVKDQHKVQLRETNGNFKSVSRILMDLQMTTFGLLRLLMDNTGFGHSTKVMNSRTLKYRLLHFLDLMCRGKPTYSGQSTFHR